MTKLLNKLERKIGKYAISNLSLYIVIGYIIGYLLYLTGSTMSQQTVSPLEFISLNPYMILQGQVWRIITWILMPPDNTNILFMAIMLYFYYSIGTALERTWGCFRYNLYIFSGILFTIIGAFIMYFITTANGADPQGAGYAISTGFTTVHISLSIFLAFAATYPNIQVLFMFIIPIKVKWLAYAYAVILIGSFIQSGPADRFAIIVSLINFFVFFFATRNYRSISPKEMYRKRAYKRATDTGTYRSGSASQKPFSGAITKHKCAICGRTEKDGDDLEFRFCSKCNGNYEYCNEHLFTHKHIV